MLRESVQRHADGRLFSEEMEDRHGLHDLEDQQNRERQIVPAHHAARHHWQVPGEDHKGPSDQIPPPEQADEREPVRLQKAEVRRGCSREPDRESEPDHRNKVALVVSYDIARAFDNAPWYLIIDALERKKCPVYLINIIRSYLTQVA